MQTHHSGSSLTEQLHAAVHLHQQGQLEEAKKIYTHIVSVDPSQADAWHLLGLVLHMQDQHDLAYKCIQKAIACDPSEGTFHNSLAECLVALNKPEEALKQYQEALVLNPKDAMVHNNMGVTYKELGDVEQAKTHYQKAVSLNPKYSDAHNNLGNLYKLSNDHEQAIRHYQDAINANPQFAEAWGNLSNEYEKINKISEARQTAKQCLALNSDNINAKLTLSQTELRDGNPDDSLEILNTIENDALDPERHSIVYNLKAQAHQKNKNYDKAFHCFSKANQVLLQTEEAKKLINQYSAHSLQTVTKWQNWCVEEAVKKWQKQNGTPPDRNPVFLVGFPRSGTTLLTQILKSHTDLNTIDEKPTLCDMIHDFLHPSPNLEQLDHLSAQDIQKYQSHYWQRAKEYQSKTTASELITIDKMPLNTINLGLVYRFFPNMKVIVAIRDPRDVCLSCFMQSFELNHTMTYFLDMDQTVRYYDAVMTLLENFRHHLNCDFLVVRYEDLIADLTTQTERLCDFLGVTWQQDMLNYHQNSQKEHILTPSYQQVVKPIYKTASKRWKHYQEHLEKYLPILNKFAALYGYQEN